MDWVITIPKTVPWEQWLAEVKDAKEKRLILHYRLPGKRDIKGLKDRCFIVHDGHVRGWLPILSYAYIKGFTCDFSGTEWPEGHYLKRIPSFHPVEPIPMKGFQGIRRFNEQSRDSDDGRSLSNNDTVI